MRKILFVSIVSAVAVALAASQAFAFSCTPVNKTQGAGVAATGTFNVDTGVFTLTSANINPAGHFRGAFIDVTVVDSSGILGQVDVFGRKDLPEGAHNAGPGDSECDGIGVDDFGECP